MASIYNRKKFLKNMLMGAAAAACLPKAAGAGVFNVPKIKKDMLGLAVIGKGNMGTGDMNTALSTREAQLIGVCDLYDRRLNAVKERYGDKVFTTKEYKEILNRKDVDVVIIGTPDHWHQKIAIDAMKAGKHVYCEKPIIHKLHEGSALISAQKQTGKILQVGSQGMASLGNRAAKLLIEAGVIGPVNLIEGQFTGGPGSLRPFVVPPEANEETIWWDRFLGNAPKRPFNAQRFLQWRNWRDYGTGIAGDLYVHVIASVHYIMDTLGPERVYTTGDIHHYKNGERDTPDVMLGYLDYPDKNNKGAFTLALVANYVDGISKKWGSTDFKIIGAGGTLNVGWNEVVLKTLQKADTSKFKVLEELGAGMENATRISDNEYVFNAPKGYRGGHFDHFTNFFNGIKNNRQVTANAEFAVRSAAPALLCYESYLSKKAIRWNPQALKIQN